MSFSFNVTGSTKEETLERVEAKLVETVASQPNHEHDRSAVRSVVETYLGLIDDKAEGEFSVSVSGSISWFVSTEQVYNGAGVSVSVRRMPS